MVASPRKEGRWTLKTDACERRMDFFAEVGRQPRESDYILVRLLSDREQSLDATHRARLSVVWISSLLRVCLEDTQSTVPIDQSPLKWYLNLADTPGAIATWPLRLMYYNFSNFHRAYVEHRSADPLRQLPVEWTDDYDVDDDSKIMAAATPTTLVLIGVTNSTLE